MLLQFGYADKEAKFITDAVIELTDALFRLPFGSAVFLSPAF